MERRTVLAFAAGGLAGLAGCSGGPAPGSNGTPRPPAQVTTSSAEGIEVLLSQIAIAPDAAGPDAYYRLRNTGGQDATIDVRTVLAIVGGDTYSASAVVTVPAADEVTLRYRIVRFDELTEAERTNVRQGDVIVDVYINGQRRTDV